MRGREDTAADGPADARRRRRILFVSHRADLSGSPLCVVDLVRGMDRTRFEPLVLLGEEGPLARLLEDAGVAPQVLPRREARGLRGWMALRRHLREWQPDLVQLTGAVAFSKSAALAARSLGRTVVWHLHDDFRLPKFRRRRFWVRRLSHRIVACAESVAREIPGPTTRVILNGVEPRAPVSQEDQRAARGALGLPDGAWVLAAVGSVKPLKNSHLIVDAALRLRERHPEARFVLMGGSDQPGFRAALAERIRQHGADSVLLWDESPDVERLLRAADLILLPSAAECFPRILLEAGALGRPALASAVGDVPAMLRDGVDGWLLPPPTTADPLQQALEEVLALGREEARRRGAEARQRIRQRYPLSRYLDAFQQLWEELLPAPAHDPGARP